ncbi:protein trichome birefringence-like 2 isoform X1 [Pistacia vera]|uniref:protein trichome birefringence-like 2 isoform X1 n=1 Tax=Pistacia vera TaxID=55513 RepID=UPI001262BBDE|nr:protein trichome birefringence-like 2 isoform X1 [Pistacia vera]
MDLKKLSFSEQLRLSPRRKVVSGFGLGVCASVIVLTILLLSNSVKTPIVAPLFQGFNGISSKNASHITRSWPFSFSTSSFNGSAISMGGNKQVNNSVDVVGKSQDANVSRIGEGQGITDLGNLTTKVEDGTGRIQNGSLVAENRNNLASIVEEVILEKNLGNFSERVNNNGSFIGEKEHLCGNCSLNAKEDVYSKRIIERNYSVNNTTDMNGKVTNNNNNFSNLSQDGGNASQPNNISISYDSRLMKKHANSFGNCDIFDGRWLRDDSKPYYPAGSCPYIDKDFDCHINGRPDDGYVKWKWQPYGCDIPSLNATDFLERLRDKKLVFVGDSLNRNMWESLVCILRHSVRNKKRVYEISGKTEFKKNGFYAFLFEDYNCTVDFVGSPFLVRESSFRGRNGSMETLRLDLMDRTTSMYHDADIIIFNTGHWWTHEKTSKGEDYYQEGNYVHPRLKVLEAYKRALTTWARWIDNNIDSHRTQVFFRGYSVSHFRGGPWNSGGQCHKETEPFFNGTYLTKYPSKMRALEHVLPEMKTPVVYLNISRLTAFRKDGHPAIYRMEYKTAEERIAAERVQDCSHWCLPGVPDSWNELLYASLLKAGIGSWRN